MKWVRISAAVLLGAVFAASLLLNVRHYADGRGPRVVSDTVKVTVTDTVTYLKPVPKDSIVISYVTEKLPVAKPDGNMGIESIPESGNISSENIPDSVEVEIPITQKVYCDSAYRAYVSGYLPSLDSIVIYSQREVVTITNTCRGRKRWGIGIQAGYGASIGRTPQLAPYIGIGISYNILNF